MAVASFWTQEFLDEVADALEVSLGRVTPAELKSDPTAAAHLEQAQAWLRAAKRAAAGSPSDQNNGATPPPFPLSGEQLRSLQRAVDRAAQARAAHGADSKTQRIVNEARNEAPVSVYERLLQGLERVRVSSRVLAAVLIAIFALTLVEFFYFQDATLRLVFAVGLFLSLAALSLWVRHYVHLSNHGHYVEGIGARI
jgi:hypothetical protein